MATPIPPPIPIDALFSRGGAGRGPRAARTVIAPTISPAVGDLVWAGLHRRHTIAEVRGHVGDVHGVVVDDGYHFTLCARALPSGRPGLAVMDGHRVWLPREMEQDGPPPLRRPRPRRPGDRHE